VRGSWVVQSDPLTGVTIIRSLLYLGFSFFYDRDAVAWGGFYHGDGLKNHDLIFML
jgi:radial spoke head protein 9